MSSSLLSCSAGTDQSSSGQCTDVNVPEGAAVLPHVPAECGKQQAFPHSFWPDSSRKGATDEFHYNSIIAWLLWDLRKTCFFTPHTTPQDPTAYPQPTTQDLAGFWDLLQLAIEDVRVKFQDLQRIKESGWRLPPEKKVRVKGHSEPVYAQINPRDKPSVDRGAAYVTETGNTQRQQSTNGAVL